MNQKLIRLIFIRSLCGLLMSTFIVPLPLLTNYAMAAGGDVVTSSEVRGTGGDPDSVDTQMLSTLGDLAKLEGEVAEAGETDLPKNTKDTFSVTRQRVIIISKNGVRQDFDLRERNLSIPKVVPINFYTDVQVSTTWLDSDAGDGIAEVPALVLRYKAPNGAVAIHIIEGLTPVKFAKNEDYLIVLDQDRVIRALDMKIAIKGAFQVAMPIVPLVKLKNLPDAATLEQVELSFQRRGNEVHTSILDDALVPIDLPGQKMARERLVEQDLMVHVRGSPTDLALAGRLSRDVVDATVAVSLAAINTVAGPISEELKYTGAVQETQVTPSAYFLNNPDVRVERTRLIEEESPEVGDLLAGLPQEFVDHLSVRASTNMARVDNTRDNYSVDEARQEFRERHLRALERQEMLDRAHRKNKEAGRLSNRLYRALTNPVLQTFAALTAGGVYAHHVVEKLGTAAPVWAVHIMNGVNYATHVWSEPAYRFPLAASSIALMAFVPFVYKGAQALGRNATVSRWLGKAKETVFNGGQMVALIGMRFMGKCILPPVHALAKLTGQKGFIASLKAGQNPFKWVSADSEEGKKRGLLTGQFVNTTEETAAVSEQEASAQAAMLVTDEPDSWKDSFVQFFREVSPKLGKLLPKKKIKAPQGQFLGFNAPVYNEAKGDQVAREKSELIAQDIDKKERAQRLAKAIALQVVSEKYGIAPAHIAFFSQNGSVKLTDEQMVELGRNAEYRKQIEEMSASVLSDLALVGTPEAKDSLALITQADMDEYMREAQKTAAKLSRSSAVMKYLSRTYEGWKKLPAKFGQILATFGVRESNFLGETLPNADIVKNMRLQFDPDYLLGVILAGHVGARADLNSPETLAARDFGDPVQNVLHLWTAPSHLVDMLLQVQIYVIQLAGSLALVYQLGMQDKLEAPAQPIEGSVLSSVPKRDGFFSGLWGYIKGAASLPSANYGHFMKKNWIKRASAITMAFILQLWIRMILVKQGFGDAAAGITYATIFAVPYFSFFWDFQRRGSALYEGALEGKGESFEDAKASIARALKEDQASDLFSAQVDLLKAYEKVKADVPPGLAQGVAEGEAFFSKLSAEDKQALSQTFADQPEIMDALRRALSMKAPSIPDHLGEGDKMRMAESFADDKVTQIAEARKLIRAFYDSEISRMSEREQQYTLATLKGLEFLEHAIKNPPVANRISTRSEGVIVYTLAYVTTMLGSYFYLPTYVVEGLDGEAGYAVGHFWQYWAETYGDATLHSAAFFAIIKGGQMLVNKLFPKNAPTKDKVEAKLRGLWDKKKPADDVPATGCEAASSPAAA